MTESQEFWSAFFAAAAPGIVLAVGIVLFAIFQRLGR